MTQITAYRCPRCGTPLVVGATHNPQQQPIHMLGCMQCGGVWLDNHTSAYVVQTACQATVQLAQQAAGSAHAQSQIDAVKDEQPHQLPCPICHHPMRTTRVANAWLDVDICDPHGVWYDRGELERVARAMHRNPHGDAQAGDWRNLRPPPVHGSPGMVSNGMMSNGMMRNGMMRNGAMAAGATAGAVGVGYAAHAAGEYAAYEWGGEIAAEVGTEIAAEVLFAIVEALF